MGCARDPYTTHLVPSARFDALTRLEPRSALPAFKNLGRGVF
jgi:hypothetical protein